MVVGVVTGVLAAAAAGCSPWRVARGASEGERVVVASAAEEGKLTVEGRCGGRWCSRYVRVRCLG